MGRSSASSTRARAEGRARPPEAPAFRRPSDLTPGLSPEAEPAPSSGIRPASVGAESASSDPLTYRVYTVADLEARALARSALAPSAPMEAAPSLTTQWRGVATSGRAAAAALVGWARSPAPRPAPLDACRAPLQAFAAELGASLRALPWRRIGVGASVGLGTVLALLFVVLMAAELTDDLRPARSSLSSHGAATNTLGATEPLSAAAVTGDATDALEPGELEEAPRAAERPAAEAKRRPDVFVP